MKRLAAAAILVLFCLSLHSQPPKPKVRAITAFVRLDPQNYEHQLAEALTVLRKTKSDFESQGYQVQSIRFTTQPLAELTAGLTENQALAFLGKLEALSVKENVSAI